MQHPLAITHQFQITGEKELSSCIPSSETELLSHHLVLNLFTWICLSMVRGDSVSSTHFSHYSYVLALCGKLLFLRTDNLPDCWQRGMRQISAPTSSEGLTLISGMEVAVYSLGQGVKCLLQDRSPLVSWSRSATISRKTVRWGR